MVLWVARHWLFLFNLAWGMYVGIPFLAPILMQLGLTTPANAIYGVYSVFCHQLPDHSFFLFGHDHAPLELVLVQGGMAEGLNLLVMRRFVGNEWLGYKVALCQRDVAIYGSVLIGWTGLWRRAQTKNRAAAFPQSLCTLSDPHCRRRPQPDGRVTREQLGAAVHHRHDLWRRLCLVSLSLCRGSHGERHRNRDNPNGANLVIGRIVVAVHCALVAVSPFLPQIYTDNKPIITDAFKANRKS